MGSSWKFARQASVEGDDADVEVRDEDAGGVVGVAEADVVQAAVVARRGDAAGVDDVAGTR